MTTAPADDEAAGSGLPVCPGLRRCRRTRRLVLVMLVTPWPLLVAAWLLREPLLRGLVHAWIVDDEFVEADAVLVLCGGPNTRPFHAAGIYTNAIAPLVLVSTVKLNPTATLRVAEDENDVNREVLLRLGVPPAAIVRVGRDLTSTWEEAEAVAAWAATNRLRSVVIPTDWYHTRRVAWTFRKVLGEEVEVKMKALPPLDYPLDAWWRNENGVICFQNEVVKMLVYLLTKRHR